MAGVPSWIRAHGLDALVVLAAVSSAVASALVRDPGQPSGSVPWLGPIAVAVVVLTLLLRHRFPFAAPVAMWVSASLLSFLDGRLIVGHAGVFAVGMVAAALLGYLSDRVRSILGLAVVLVSAALIVRNNPAATADDLLFVPGLFGIGWLVGWALRDRANRAEEAEQRAIRAEREREVATRLAVAEERARIARELHDIVAHAVSVMVLQTGAVRHRMPSGDQQDRAALMAVEQSGRTALTEMRQLLGAIRDEGDLAERTPHPGLDGLPALARQVRAAGLEVTMQVHGLPMALPASLELSAYRIVQEGLTNCLKHANARHAEVCVDVGPDALELQVLDDGQGPVAHDGVGYGLLGVQERVKVFAGEMSAGPRAGGGYQLLVRLPYCNSVGSTSPVPAGDDG